MDAGSLIKATRQRHRIDQRALAIRAGTSQTHISRIERGEVSPSFATVERLLAVMGERLELNRAPGPRGNESKAELQHEYRRQTAGQRVARAAELSHALTSIAAGRRR